MLEARDVLYVLEQKADRPLRLEAKSLRLAGKLLDLCYKEKNIKLNGEDEAKKILESGNALKKFQEIVKAQGGDHKITSDSLELAKNKFDFKSSISGKIKDINNHNLNTVAKILGSPNDKKAGIYLLKKLDHSVIKNETIFTLYSDDKYRLKEAEVTLENLPIFKIE
jgi:AMP phosphorylase